MGPASSEVESEESSQKGGVVPSCSVENAEILDLKNDVEQAVGEIDRLSLLALSTEEENESLVQKLAASEASQASCQSRLRNRNGSNEALNAQTRDFQAANATLTRERDALKIDIQNLTVENAEIRDGLERIQSGSYNDEAFINVGSVQPAQMGDKTDSHQLYEGHSIYVESIRYEEIPVGLFLEAKDFNYQPGKLRFKTSLMGSFQSVSTGDFMRIINTDSGVLFLKFDGLFYATDDPDKRLFARFRIFNEKS